VNRFVLNCKYPIAGEQELGEGSNIVDGQGQHPCNQILCAQHMQKPQIDVSYSLQSRKR
jgi:hypothetical protein